LLIVMGAAGVGISASIIAITLLASELLGAKAPLSVLAFEAALLFTATLWLALGAIELRLIEIRLELMMMNGGTRGADRRQAPRRGDRKGT
jgi:membrane protein implicated in regulation of membrane protease activity